MKNTVVQFDDFVKMIEVVEDGKKVYKILTHKGKEFNNYFFNKVASLGDELYYQGNKIEKFKDLSEIMFAEYMSKEAFDEYLLYRKKYIK